MKLQDDEVNKVNTIFVAKFFYTLLHFFVFLFFTNKNSFFLSNIPYIS